MRLRNVLAAIAVCALAVALLASLREPGFRPPTLMLAALAVALLVERRRYGVHAAPAPGAAPTVERFVDPESGRMMRVWYDPATGERSYVEDQAG